MTGRLTVTTIDPIQLLHNVFPELNNEDIQTLNQAAGTQFYKAGTDILLEGETGTTLYILGQGYAEILVQANNQEILIDTVGPNSYFGEMAFLGETTRTATIRAKTECHTLTLDEKDFMPIARANPNLLRTLLRQIIGHLRRNDEAVIKEFKEMIETTKAGKDDAQMVVGHGVNMANSIFLKTYPSPDVFQTKPYKEKLKYLKKFKKFQESYRQKDLAFYIGIHFFATWLLSLVENDSELEKIVQKELIWLSQKGELLGGSI